MKAVTPLSAKPPLICLHSSGLSGAQWTRLAARLDDEYDVRNPDFLGYGSDPRPYSAPFHYDQDLDVLLGSISAPTIVIGHSYGGLLALQLALRAPERVRALILFDPIAWGALYSHNETSPEQLAGARFLDPDSSAEEWLESFLEFWGEPGAWASVSPRVRQSMLASYPKMRAEVESLVNDSTSHLAYQAIHCPTLLIGGRRSPQLQKDVMEILSRSIPGAELSWMEGGHMAPISDGETFANLVSDFLGRLPAS